MDAYISPALTYMDPDLDAEISLMEVTTEISNLGKDKATGLDNIPNEAIKSPSHHDLTLPATYTRYIHVKYPGSPVRVFRETKVNPPGDFSSKLSKPLGEFDEPGPAIFFHRRDDQGGTTAARFDRKVSSPHVAKDKVIDHGGTTLKDLAAGYRVRSLQKLKELIQGGTTAARFGRSGTTAKRFGRSFQNLNFAKDQGIDSRRHHGFKIWPQVKPRLQDLAAVFRVRTLQRIKELIREAPRLQDLAAASEETPYKLMESCDHVLCKECWGKLVKNTENKYDCPVSKKCKPSIIVLKTEKYREEEEKKSLIEIRKKMMGEMDCLFGKKCQYGTNCLYKHKKKQEDPWQSRIDSSEETPYKLMESCDHVLCKECWGKLVKNTENKYDCPVSKKCKPSIIVLKTEKYREEEEKKSLIEIRKKMMGEMDCLFGKKCQYGTNCLYKHKKKQEDPWQSRIDSSEETPYKLMESCDHVLCKECWGKLVKNTENKYDCPVSKKCKPSIIVLKTEKYREEEEKKSLIEIRKKMMGEMDCLFGKKCQYGTNCLYKHKKKQEDPWQSRID
ncbi:hypothetical protein LAZ67_1001012 [Cordylochernes scorpioides]|uniref:RING-type E3 ubiquitin transferase n=1 Tax=Cordylochernes scorpioides TaxID=51811 RepID=A0ABY6JW38_9ARAC|nr:hypothetical protein LAZ67_1001012 [Cordylochernes scorpioides]